LLTIRYWSAISDTKTIYVTQADHVTNITTPITLAVVANAWTEINVSTSSINLPVEFYIVVSKHAHVGRDNAPNVGRSYFGSSLAGMTTLAPSNLLIRTEILETTGPRLFEMDSTSSSSSTGTIANISVKSTWAQPQVAYVNQPVTIYANAFNSGDAPGGFTVNMKINGAIEETKTGIAQPNSAVPLQFTVIKDKPGTYSVNIDGKETTFSVVADNSKPAMSVEKTMSIALIAVVGILVIALAFALYRRRAR
jgi:hypothetical protein